MVVAAGPRIISSSMGPIPYAEAASGQSQISISVTFDRPVDPNTVSVGDVEVFYHNTSNTGSSISRAGGKFRCRPAGGTSPTTQFTIIVQRNGAPAQRLHRHLQLLDRSGQRSASPSAHRSSPSLTAVLRNDDPMDQNADGTSTRTR